MPDGRACSSMAGSAWLNASAINAMFSIQDYTIQTLVSGRYLLQLPSYSGPAPLFVGFHGYGQTAEDELALLRCIPGSERWLVVPLRPFTRFILREGTREQAG